MLEYIMDWLDKKRRWQCLFLQLRTTVAISITVQQLCKGLRGRWCGFQGALRQFSRKASCFIILLLLFSEIYNKQTMDPLQRISFFPYFNWWRLDTRQNIKSHFGGIVTILVLAIVGIIFGYRLKEVFSKTKMTVQQTFMIEDNTNSGNFTTYQKDPNMLPLVVALNPDPFLIYHRLDKLNRSDFNFHVKVKKRIENVPTYQYTALQNCTKEHFGNYMSNHNYSYSGWLCLPINKTFECNIDESLNHTNANVSIELTCKSDRCKEIQSYDEERYFTLNLLQTEPNPQNITHPFSFHMVGKEIIFRKTPSYNYYLKLIQNSILTDQNLLPIGSNIHMQVAYKADIINMQAEKMLYAQASANIFLLRQPKTYIYRRSFQKLLDAVSYIGGIFQAILGLFIFMEFFNASYFEMKFASTYFKCKAARGYGFLAFIKQALYNTLHKTPIGFQSEAAQARRKIEEAVKKLQDVIYINRRIQFLEKATNILLEKHQVKALRLIHNKTGREIIEDYKKQKFRDRFIYFLIRNNLMDQEELNQDLEEQNQDQQDPQLDIKNRIDDIYGQVIDSEKKKPNQQNNQQSSKRLQKFELEVANNSIQMANKKMSKISVNGLSSIQNLHLAQLQQSELHKKNLSRKNQRRTNIQKTNIRYSQQYRPQEKKQVILDEIEQLDLKEFEKEGWKDLDAAGHLKRLVNEAQKPDGDVRSRKIFEMMESHLQQQLKVAINRFGSQQQSLTIPKPQAIVLGQIKYDLAE